MVLTGPEALHLARVLRVRPGQPVTAFDGQGKEAAGTVRLVEDTRVTVTLMEPQTAAVEAALAVTVAVALLKGDKLAETVRQCTELGAHAFQPFVSRHSDVRELAPRKLERLQRIATEAAKQSGRALVPTVAAAVASSSLPSLFAGRQVIIADPRAHDTLAAVQTQMQGQLVTVTGPEGGFSGDELQAFSEHGF